MLANIKDWHDTFQWQLEYRSVEEPTELGKKPKIKKVVFVGAPAPADIAKAAYGEKVDAKLKQATIERLIPCITNGERFPRDLMISAVDRATNSIGLDYWEQQKTQNIACALVRGYYHRNKKVDYPKEVLLLPGAEQTRFLNALHLSNVFRSPFLAETSDNRTTDSLYYQWRALPAGFDDQRGRSGNKQHWPGLLGTTKNTKHCLCPCAWVLS